MQLVTVNIWEASEYDKRGELKRQAEAVNREISIEGPVVWERRQSSLLPWLWLPCLCGGSLCDFYRVGTGGGSPSAQLTTHFGDTRVPLAHPNTKHHQHPTPLT